MDPEREVAQAGIGIAGIVKGHSSDIISDQGKTEFGLIEQEGRASQGETRGGIARPRLIFRKAAMRSAAAAEKALRQRHRVQRIAKIRERIDVAEFGAARQHQLLADGVIGGVARQEAEEVDFRTEEVPGESDIDGVIEPFVGVHRIVAAVLDHGERRDTDAHRLR